jgi:hypothetical protein
MLTDMQILQAAGLWNEKQDGFTMFNLAGHVRRDLLVAAHVKALAEIYLEDEKRAARRKAIPDIRNMKIDSPELVAASQMFEATDWFAPEDELTVTFLNTLTVRDKEALKGRILVQVATRRTGNA